MYIVVPCKVSKKSKDTTTSESPKEVVKRTRTTKKTTKTERPRAATRHTNSKRHDSASVIDNEIIDTRRMIIHTTQQN